VSAKADQRPWEERRTGLGILAAGLLFAVQDHLYARLEEAGYGNVTRAHGSVIAHLDQDGTRASELARRSGRHRQIIGRIVDELEELGYVERRPEKKDRRAKLVVPTERGRALMRFSDSVIDELEQEQRDALGMREFERFRRTLSAIVESLTQTGSNGSSPPN
jgi:DNA-binding MarR family transcriptional regulator